MAEDTERYGGRNGRSRGEGSLSLPTVVFLGPAAVCVAAWFGVGNLIPARLLPADTLLRPLARLAAGSLAFTLFVFTLGRLHVLLPAVVLGVTVSAAIPGAVLAVRKGRSLRLPRGYGRLWWTLTALVALALLLDVAASTAPPTSADALWYHLELPRRWLDLHRIDDPLWSYPAFDPLGVEMLFAQAMAVVGMGGAGSAMAAGSAASGLHGLLAVLAVVAVYGLARELGAGRALAGAIGCALFALQGLVTWDATSTFIEMGLAFYTTLTAWFALRFVRGRRRADAVWTGVAGGAAIGAKYVGPVAVGVVLGALSALELRRRRLLPVGIAIATTLLLGGAWYLRNWIATGNPVYPLLFGGKLWNGPAADYLNRSATNSYPGTHTFPLRFLILPLDLVRHGARYDRGEYASTATLLLAPAAVLVARSRELAGVFAVTLGFVLVWWYWIPQVRYLLPALAVLAALAGAGLAPVVTRGGWARALVLATIAVSGVVWLVSSAALTRQLLPVAFGAEGRAHNVQRLLGTYDAMQAIHRRVGDAQVGFAPAYQMIYWYPGPAINVGLPEFETQLPRAVFLARLHSTGVRYMVTWGNLLEQYPQFRGCARHLATFPGRYVTSRSKGTSEPLAFDLWAVDGC